MTTNNECCSYCQQTSILPVRSSWARAALLKVENDQTLDNIDRRTWYRLTHSDLLHEEYRKVFQELHEDEATTAFLEQSQEKSDNFPIQFLHSLASTLLTVFIARTSGLLIPCKRNVLIAYLLANGLIGRGRMFVYSTAQFKTLLDIDSNQQSQLTSLLDIGAGDGSITQRMADLFKNIYATEMSSIMQWRLSNYGYKILDTDQWGDVKFDVISCLNVLDRCEKPLSLLKKIREHLNPDSGRVIISLVLPFKPYFEYNNDHSPNESIHIQGRLPEEQINEFILNVFQPLGFQLKKLSRLPYLCEGDMERSYYFLSDYIFVLTVY
jgi:2-polyprenyl-3-methyl-5-hydroxy-6-metoxy-1,4-benzoquinol methylase